MKISVKVTDKVKLDAVKKKAKKAEFKSIEHIIKAIALTVKRSIRERKGKVKTEQLHLYTPRGRRVFLMSEHLANRNDKNIRVVTRDKWDVRDPKQTADYRETPAAKAGAPPNTYPSDKPGWYDFWLRKSIRAFISQNGEAGYVESSPAKSASPSHKNLPQVLEAGGRISGNQKGRLLGYQIFTTWESAPARNTGKSRKFKQARVRYKPVYAAPIPSPVKVESHPFMKPALEKNKDRIPKAWRDAIAAELQ